MRRRIVTSTLCKSRAPATTGAASGHHGVATSTGAGAPIGSPEGPTKTSVTVRGMNFPRLPQPYETLARSVYLASETLTSPHATVCQDSTEVFVRHQPTAFGCTSAELAQTCWCSRRESNTELGIKRLLTDHLRASHGGSGRLSRIRVMTQ